MLLNNLFFPSSTSLVAIRLFDDANHSIKKVLKDEWYLLNHWYVLKNNKLFRNDDEFTSHRHLYGPNVTVQAIVGKNGSGKSSLLELIYRMFNNLSYIITKGMERPKAEDIYYINGIHAKLFFETEGELGSLECNGPNITLAWGNIIEKMSANQLFDDYSKEADIRLIDNVSRCFGYALVSNYAMMSLAPIDFGNDETQDDGNWINSIYCKNDGYQACIGIEPYKGFNSINLHTQSSLFKARIESTLVESRGREFFDGYSYDKITLDVDEEYTSRKVYGKETKREKWPFIYEKRFSHYATRRSSIVYKILLSYNLTHLNLSDKTINTAATYLVWKTLSVVEVYNQFAKYRPIGNTQNYRRDAEATFKKYIEIQDDIDLNELEFSNAAGLIEDMCMELRKDRSHATLKLRQTIDFLDYAENKCKENGSWVWKQVATYDEYMERIHGGKIPTRYDDISSQFPPPIFQPIIYLKREKSLSDAEELEEKAEGVPYNTLSTGERQFMQIVASMLYHIRNVVSVKKVDGMLKYHNIFLFLDEIEVSFHPEYQQRFIKLFLDTLEKEGLLKHCNVNITIATHSPFILSDIPRNNILCLENGKNKSEAIERETFAANVYDLLNNQFFLDKFIGEFAYSKISESIKKMKEWDLYQKNGESKNIEEGEFDSVHHVINLIGDKYLRTKLTEKLLSYHPDHITAQEYLKKKQELEELKIRLKL